MSVPAPPEPERNPDLGRDPDPGRDLPAPAGTTVSGRFVALVAAFAGIAAIAVMVPDLRRFTPFPLVMVGWLISLCVHEFGHAVVAYGSGDLSMRDKGYLTLDPLRYVNVQFSIVWPLLILAIGGIGLPGGAVYVNTAALRTRWRRSLVFAAGPLATFAVLLALLFVLQSGPSSPLYESLAFLAFLQLTALALNLLPVPGLDGWGVVEPWLPGAVRTAAARFAPVAVALLFVLLFFRPVNRAFFMSLFGLGQMIGLDVDAAIDGLERFQFWNWLAAGH